MFYCLITWIPQKHRSVLCRSIVLFGNLPRGVSLAGLPRQCSSLSAILPFIFSSIHHHIDNHEDKTLDLQSYCRPACPLDGGLFVLFHLYRSSSWGGLGVVNRVAFSIVFRVQCQYHFSQTSTATNNLFSIIHTAVHDVRSTLLGSFRDHLCL